MRAIVDALSVAAPARGGRNRQPAGTRRVGARQNKTSLAAPPATAGATYARWRDLAAAIRRAERDRSAGQAFAAGECAAVGAVRAACGG